MHMDGKCFDILYKNFKKTFFLFGMYLCMYNYHKAVMKYIHNEIPIQLEVYVMGLFITGICWSNFENPPWNHYALPYKTPMTQYVMIFF